MLLVTYVVGELAGKTAHTIRKLGVDYAHGVRGAQGTQSVRAGRWKKALKRIKRAKLLFEKRQGRGKLFYAGVMPSFEFGADIIGVAAKAASFLKMAGEGRSQDSPGNLQQEAQRKTRRICLKLRRCSGMLKNGWLRWGRS